MIFSCVTFKRFTADAFELFHVGASHSSFACATAPCRKVGVISKFRNSRSDLIKLVVWVALTKIRCEES